VAPRLNRFGTCPQRFKEDLVVTLLESCRVGTHSGDAAEDVELVGLVLVSHSRMLVEGLRDMVAQVAGGAVPVAIAGGTIDGRLGTSVPLVTAAVQAVDSADGVLVLLDLGSAALSVEIALEDLPSEVRARVLVSGAPLVEGSIVAAVQASLGASLTEVAEAADGAVRIPKLPEPIRVL
jgi:PTS hybrid protein